MKFSQLKNQNILLLGFGAEGRVTFDVLKKELDDVSRIVIADMNESIDCPENTKCQFGESYLDNLDAFDVIIKSPGIPMNEELEMVRDKIISATQLFFDNIDISNQVIGITGSKGKSTVTSLIYEVLKEGGEDVTLVGNIGKPALEQVHKKDTTFIFELSSYQLEDLDARINTAVFVSFFPDHLNYHGDIDAYFTAKSHIAKYQTEADMFLYHKKYARVSEVQTKALKVGLGDKETLWHDGNDFYRGDNLLFTANDLQLLGDHNLDNILFVLQVAQIYAIPMDIVKKVVENFKGLPHRLEYVGEVEGIHFYDDAISTTPESTLAALSVFEDKLGTLILGGLDRGYDFGELAKAIVDLKIQNLVFFPDSGEKIKSVILSLCKEVAYKPNILETKSMKDAVDFCFENTEKGKVCLLSTASPSYSIFKNFEDKGDQFKQNVLNREKHG